VRLSRSAVSLICTGVFVIGLIPLGLPSAAPAAASAAKLPAPGVLLPNGRLATPAGSPYDALRTSGEQSYDLGDFPEGLALSPNGQIAVASLNGRGEGQPHGFNSFCEQDQFVEGVKCPGVPKRLTENAKVIAPDEGLDVIDIKTGHVVQVTAVKTNNLLPQQEHAFCNQGFNCFGVGVTFSPDGKYVYAAGGGDDSIYDFAVHGDKLKLLHTVAVPSLSSKVPALPIEGAASGYPEAVAVTPDGKTLLAADLFDSTLEAFSLTPGKAPTLEAQGLVAGGIPGPAPLAYLDSIVVSPNGQYAYVAAEGTGIVYAVDLAAFEASGIVTHLLPGVLSSLGPAIAVPVPIVGINHPTGLAVSPDGSTLLVAGSDSDNVAAVKLIAGIPSPLDSTVRLEADPTRPRSVLGSSPVDVAYAAGGKRAYVAMAGDDVVAVLDTTGATPKRLGYIPTGWYPTAVAIGPTDHMIYTVSAKGLGSRYVAGVGGYTAPPGQPLPKGASVPTSSYYDAENMPGLLTRVAVPTRSRLAAYTRIAAIDLEHAGGLDQRSTQNPIPARVGDPSPIKHVVYIVRENRTFDQVFGDLGLKRGDVDADPADQTLAEATPNAHEVAGRYAIADHFFSDGEASVQGHWWTAAANVNNYVESSWRQYYSPRGRPGDSAILPITTPPGCTIFQALQAYQLTHPKFTFENYGELVGLVTPTSSVGSLLTNLCWGTGPATAPDGNTFSDVNYPSEIQLVPDDRIRAKEFLNHSGLTTGGHPLHNGQYLRNFNYLILSEDHTSGLAGTYTPRSQVAQNDAALGEIIHGLSKSKYWNSTAVFVEEDDSQDGIDHVDGHRNILLVASPYAKQVSADGCLPGYVSHPHFDQASVLRTIELILGIHPISSYDAGATPLYDMFQSIDHESQLTKADLRPFPIAKPPPFIDETVASLPHTAKNRALIAYSKSLNTVNADVSEAGIEDVLWQTLMKTPVPPSLAAAAAGAPQTSAVTGASVLGSGESVVDDALGALSDALDLEPVEVRPGTPPALSTVTGAPLTSSTSAAHKPGDCPAHPVPATYPVAPGQTKLPASAGTAPELTAATSEVVSSGVLPATGLTRIWPEWLAFGLVLIAAGLWRMRRRAEQID
jgi:DNA-binding beta-propeller fold protein YncE